MSRYLKKYLIVVLILHFVQSVSAQTNTGTNPSTSTDVTFTESALPIVVINTNSQTIKDDPKIIVDMGIIYNGPGVRNHMTDPFNNYNGKIAIEIRGSSSQQFPKKSYGFETRNSSGNVKVDVSLLGMPAEHDWILSANYTDKSFCRNVLAYQLANEMGHYAVRTKYVDVVLNNTYIGIYVFMESIKRDSNRVDIANLHRNEITPPDITGGYILKVDKTTGSGGDGWTSSYPPINHSNNQHTFIQYDSPSEDSIVPSQEAYIQAYVDSFEDALAGSNFRDSILGYKNFMAPGSWMDYFFSDEISKNVDGYRISSYLYKDKEKKLRAGPVWDFDIAWGNANYCNGNDTTGWGYLFPCTGDGYQVPFWWQRLLQDTNYTNEMKCRWNKYRQGVLSVSHVNGVIDSIATLLNESKDWNFQKWQILGTYVWPNPSPYPSTYAGEIQNLKNWVTRRLAWLDSNMPGSCSCNMTPNVQSVSCNGECDGRAIAVGSSPYKKSYLWSNSTSNDTLSNLCPGTYSVTMTDDIGCTKTSSVTITQPSVLSASTNSVNSTCAGTGCNGSATANVSGGTTPYSYSWSGGQSSATASALCQGNYIVTITDAHGCTKTSSANIQNPSAPVLSISALSSVTCPGGSDGFASVNVNGGTGPYSYSWSTGSTGSSASGLTGGIHSCTVMDATGCSSVFTVDVPEPDVIVLNPSVTNAVCNGQVGSASVAVTGGTSPYDYAWSNGSTASSINSVALANYVLTVTDAAGCTKSSSISISEPAAFAFVSTTNSPTCSGGSDGSAEVSATGGTGAISYSWSPGGASGSVATQLSSGNYVVTVTDASNCSATRSVTVIDPPAISLTTSSTPATCGMNDGTATVHVSNGTSPYQYNWIPSPASDTLATNLSAGNYAIVVTDAHNCSATDSVTVSSLSGLNVSVSGQTEVSCVGGSDASATLTVSGGSGFYIYSWSPSGGNGSTASNLSAGVYSVTISQLTGCSSVYQLSITDPVPLSATITSTAAVCAGDSSGTLSADGGGGTGPYTYRWSPGAINSQTISNLLAGNYTVRVTDAHGCSSTFSATVGEPSPISIVAHVIDSRCGDSNGSASVTVSGGAGNYSYDWSNSSIDSVAEYLSAGTYSISVTDSSGCMITENVTIGGTSAPVITASGTTPITCNGGSNGSATMNVSGGAGGYSYAWTPNVSTGLTANNLAAGIYSVVVTDAGQCTDSTGFILSQPAPLAALIFSDNVRCFGGNDGQLYADAGGGTSPYTYSWSDGQHSDTAANLAPGNYSLIITDSHNCSTSLSGTVFEPDSIWIDFNITNATCSTCTDGSVKAIVNGGTAPFTYYWHPLGQVTDSISQLGKGTYTLCATDAKGCMKCDSAKVVGGVIGVEEIIRNSAVYVYPNPVSGEAVFAFMLKGKQMVDIQIFSASGQLVKTLVSEELSGGEHLIRFNADDLVSGIYFYRFTISSQSQAGRLVIGH